MLESYEPNDAHNMRPACMDVETRAGRYSGGGEVWLSGFAIEAFVKSAQKLYDTLSGSVTIAMPTPSHFALTVSAANRGGLMKIVVVIGDDYDEETKSFLLQSRVEFTVEPSQILVLVKGFSSFLDGQ
ncbi:MAG: hypothetical protein HYR85_25870 [Planctomycetes bacterium]|nr:hypothetical protein [Planctomycetota bacterium]MBI3845317.1 hypothetical protein [Planctomycetota bacterium]